MTGSSEPTSRSPLRVLFLATYFPKPANALMGTWALSQAQALRRQGVDLRVVSFTSWVPKWAALTGGAKAYANCPERHQWGDLNVEYPRWLLYQAGPPKRWAYPNPRRQLAIAWASAKRRLRAIVREHRPDMIYAHHSGVNGYLAWRLKQEFGIPYVITDHDFGEIADCEKFPGRREVYQPIVDNASTIVCVASRMERDLNRIFPAANARTVQNGTDPIPPPLWQSPRPSEIDRKLVIFSVGAFYERKGFPILIRAFAQIASKHPSAVLRIAGDGDTRADVDRAVRESGVADRIQLLGFQPHDRVMQEMVWSDLFALVGWDEPFATVFIEAMAAGKPIVWANDGGINDVLRNGEHGIAVIPRDVNAAADALDRLLSDASARSQMGDATKRLHESKLTWDANARTMIEIFEDAKRNANSNRIGLALINNSQTPYRLHLHKRIAREMPEIKLWSIFTHEVSNAPWALKSPPEIGPVMFGQGERSEDQSNPRFAWREWKKGGRIIRFLREHDVRAVVIGGYNDPGRIRIIRWCRRHGVARFLFGDSNIRGDRATGARAWVKRILLRRIIGWCSGVMSCGRLGDEYFIKYGAKPERIFRFPYEADYDLIRNLPQEKIDEVAARFSLSTSRCRIIYSGRLVPHKRVDLLIDAFIAIAGEKPEWDLVVAGDGAQRGELEARVPESLRSRATWAGFVDEPQVLAALYRSSDILVLPSDEEPWGVVVTEAASAGLAIVASDRVGAAADVAPASAIFAGGDVASLADRLRCVMASLEKSGEEARENFERWHAESDPVRGLSRALQAAGVALSEETEAGALTHS